MLTFAIDWIPCCPRLIASHRIASLIERTSARGAPPLQGCPTTTHTAQTEVCVSLPFCIHMPVYLLFPQRNNGQSPLSPSTCRRRFTLFSGLASRFPTTVRQVTRHPISALSPDCHSQALRFAVRVPRHLVPSSRVSKSPIPSMRNPEAATTFHDQPTCIGTYCLPCSPGLHLPVFLALCSDCLTWRTTRCNCCIHQAHIGTSPTRMCRGRKLMAAISLRPCNWLRRASLLTILPPTTAQGPFFLKKKKNKKTY